MRTYKNLRFDDDKSTIRLMQTLSQPNISVTSYRKTFYEIGKALGQLLNKKTNGNYGNTMLACASEDADWLAHGVLDGISQKEVSLAVFWNERVTLDSKTSLEYSPIIKSFVEEIKDLMLEAQKEAYGDGLDHQYLHPYMWTWKPHYYEADYAFYNFPYAFGLLLAKGLYGLYQKQGQSFADTYEHFLSLTGQMSLEDVGKSVGIDLQDMNFWQNSIDMIKDDIDLFEELLKDVQQ